MSSGSDESSGGSNNNDEEETKKHSSSNNEKSNSNSQSQLHVGPNGKVDKSHKRKKHMRRTAAEIEREFICPYPECGKLYGSEGSLNLHIKIKHNGGNKTEREKMAVSLVKFISI